MPRKKKTDVLKEIYEEYTKVQIEKSALETKIFELEEKRKQLDVKAEGLRAEIMKI